MYGISGDVKIFCDGDILYRLENAFVSYRLCNVYAYLASGGLHSQAPHRDTAPSPRCGTSVPRPAVPTLPPTLITPLTSIGVIVWKGIVTTPACVIGEARGAILLGDTFSCFALAT